MTKINSSDDLKHVLSRHFISQSFRVFFKFVKNSVIHIFKNQIKPSFPSKNFYHINQIVMTKFLKST